PAILTLSPAGNLLQVALPPQIATDDRNLLRLAYGWEFVARNAASYQEEELAAEGPGTIFRASYARSDDVHIRKTRLVQPASGSHAGDGAQNVVASEFTGTVGNLWLREMSGWEDTVMYLNQDIFAATRISVSFRQETNAPALPPALATLLSD